MMTAPEDLTTQGVTLFFPVYHDEGTVRIVADKALGLLRTVAEEYEIIIVDDCSPDRSGAIADEIAREHPCVRVIHHAQNLGYGAAMRAGLAAARYEYVCMIDGDDEYEVEDFRKLLNLREHYDLLITFRYKKIYSSKRIFLSWVYNRVFSLLFRTRFRDISTGLRLARRSMLSNLSLDANSTFIGAELAIKAMLRGYRVGEVGIQTFPRQFGRSSSTTLRSIADTVLDMVRIYRKVFSDTYELPANRRR